MEFGELTESDVLISKQGCCGFEKEFFSLIRYAASWKEAGKSSHTQIGGRFERSSADAADYRRAITTGKRIGDFTGAIRAVKRVVRLLWIYWLGHFVRPLST